LGFLLYTLPLGNNYEISLAFWTAFQLAFNWLLISLGWSYHKTSAIWVKYLSTLLAVLFINSLKLEFVPVFFVFISTLLYAWEKKPKFFILSALSVTLAFLIKISTGIICFLIMGSICLLEKKNLKMNWKLIATGTFTAIITFFSTWILLYGDLAGTFDFLWSNKELSSGYASAMSVRIPIKGSFIFIAVLNYILCIFLWKNSFLKAIYLSLALPLLAWFKYAYGRADPYHIIHFWFLFLALTLFVSLFLKKPRDLIPYGGFFVISWALIFGFYKWTPNNKEMPPLQVFNQILSETTLNFNGHSHFYSSLLQPGRKDHLIKSSQYLLKEDLLEPSILEYVGNNPVDVYPWEQSIIHANGLNWKPRRVIQSYFSFTPWLDQVNSESIENKSSARHLIWHNMNFGSIDGRYLLNDEPRTIYQIFKNYKLKFVGKKFAVLDRTDKPLLGKPIVFSTSEYSRDQWIDVPENKNEIIQGDVFIKRSLLGKIKRLIFKEEPFFITYRFENGYEAKTRMVADTAVHGIWMNPFIYSMKPGSNQSKLPSTKQKMAPTKAHESFNLWNNQLNIGKIIQVKFNHDPYDYIEETIKINWKTIPVLPD